MALTRKGTQMTTIEIISRLLKHYKYSYDVNVAVSNHRRQNPNWNWVAAAHDLLSTIEGKNYEQKTL